MPYTGVLIFLLLPLIQGAPVSTINAVQYLERFGYIQPAKLVAENVTVEEEDPATMLTNAIKIFQTSAGLPVTGELDDATKKKMMAPRCGVPEFAALNDGDDIKWTKQDLTYTLDTNDSGMSESETRNGIKASFDVFTAVIPLTFREVEGEEDVVDLKIRFGRKDHNCYIGDPDEDFDGVGGTMAHAYFPDNGRIHFDADDKWTVMNATNMPTDHFDFLGTAIHEIGHALGLDHVHDDPSSIMAPYDIPPYDENGNYIPPKLDEAVIKTLHHLYGTVGTPVDNGGSGQGTGHNCLKHVYAAVTLPNFRFMLFNDKGSRATVFNARTRKATQSGPISEFFSSGPERVITAYYDKKKSYMMLFRGTKVWRYNFAKYQFKLAEGYPKELPVESEWETEGAWNTKKGRVIVSFQKEVARYNDEKNTLEVLGNLDDVYPNMPAAVAGFAEINGKEFGFTEHSVFSYNWDTQSNKEIGSIGEFLHC